MADMSDYLEVTLLNETLNGVAFTAVNNPYISLHTANPTDAGTGAEVSGGSYARTASSFATASALDAAKTIDSGDVFKITSGNLTVTLA